MRFAFLALVFALIGPMARGYTIDLDGPPFGVITTQDGSDVFVALTGARAGVPMGIAVLTAQPGRPLHFVRRLPTPRIASEMALTHDGRCLVASCGDAIVAYDLSPMIRDPRRAPSTVATFSDGPHAGAIFVAVSRDDRLLFVSDEDEESITVYDLAVIRAHRSARRARIGRIPVGNAPVALVPSPDGRWLYSTSEVADESWNWPRTITPENHPDRHGKWPQGAVVVIDVAKAAADPAHAVVSRVPAGGSPVRAVLSPSGDRLYVTARNSNAVLVFDTAKLLNDPEHARIASVPVGTAPVPLVLFRQGTRLLVGNSNRFGSSSGSLTLIDTGRIGRGASPSAVIGTRPCGEFPRELRLSPDGSVIYLTNFRSRTLEVIAVRGL